MRTLDISFNPYSIQSTQNLFEGLYGNKSLKEISMIGIPIAQINIHKFCEIMSENSSLESISWDMEINEEDLDIFKKLEKMALMNFSLLQIKTTKTDISLNNNLSSLLFLYLQSNQWIHENIKSVNQNGIPPCPVILIFLIFLKGILELFITSIKRKIELLAK